MKMTSVVGDARWVASLSRMRRSVTSRLDPSTAMWWAVSADTSESGTTHATARAKRAARP